MSPETEKNKMLTGKLYNANDPELVKERESARDLCQEYNTIKFSDHVARNAILKELFGESSDPLTIEPPFTCDYGSNIFAGKGVYMNLNCVILDCNIVRIGDDTLMGPNVQVYCATHPLEPELRRQGLELSLPVSIGKNVWIGGNAVICPGISIGNDSVIGPGSIVIKSIPSGVFAAGNPCKVIKHL
ncbi:MAG: sugar O-acetyltransferase [Candidatus Lokiarchaeota archaeon]|nr:sugar O-acetyltransferase [Candidatus Lokiarchaeota archaeon]